MTIILCVLFRQMTFCHSDHYICRLFLKSMCFYVYTGLFFNDNIFAPSYYLGDDFLPQSPLFGKPISEQHVYLPFYEGNQMQSSKSGVLSTLLWSGLFIILIACVLVPLYYLVYKQLLWCIIIFLHISWPHQFDM